MLPQTLAGDGSNIANSVQYIDAKKIGIKEISSPVWEAV
jgi:hypothetical protein